MKVSKNFNRTLVILTILVCAYLFALNTIIVHAQTTSIVSNFQDNLYGRRVKVFDKYEANFSISEVYSNPYDSDIIEINANVQDPSGKSYSIPAFWYEGFARNLVNNQEILQPNGGNTWKIRFTPNIVGNYKYQIEIKDKAKQTTTYYPTNDYITFTSEASSNKGFIKISSVDNSYLEFGNGQAFIGLGHNLDGWEYPGGISESGLIHGYNNTKGTYDYDNWLTKFNTNGANNTQFDFGEGDQLEWTKANTNSYTAGWSGLGQYNQQSAWKMDYKIDKANQLGIYYTLDLWHWEDFDVNNQNTLYGNWNRNPYNSANGGPISKLDEFFTNSTAINDQRKLIRYIVARYSYSSNLIAWQIFNEADTGFFNNPAYPNGYSSTIDNSIATWHATIADYIKSLDVNKHLISTSFGSVNLGSKTLTLPQINIVPLHTYTEFNVAAGLDYPNFTTEPVISLLLNTKKTSYNKPVYFGEFALSAAGYKQRYDDQSGIAFHNQLWTSILSKSSITAMSWTWQSYIDQNNLYTFYKPLQAFLDDENLEGLNSDSNMTLNDSKNIKYVGLKSSTKGYYWVANKYYNFLGKDQYANSPVSNETFTFNGLTDGVYKIIVYDTYSGNITYEGPITIQNQTANYTLPTFTKDIAIKILPSTTQVSCGEYNYSPWSSCVAGKQTRTIISSKPASCVQSSAVLEQYCDANTQAACKADINKDKTIGISDFAYFATFYRSNLLDCSKDLAGDDCYLNIQDFSLFAKNYKVPNLCF